MSLKQLTWTKELASSFWNDLAGTAFLAGSHSQSLRPDHSWISCSLIFASPTSYLTTVGATIFIGARAIGTRLRSRVH